MDSSNFGPLISVKFDAYYFQSLKYALFLVSSVLFTYES